MALDIDMQTHVGWTFPDQLLAECEREDDESSLTITYHGILTDKVVEEARKIFRNEPIDPELLKDGNEWVEKIKWAIEVTDEDWQQSGAPPMDEEEVLDMISHWIDEEVQPEIDHYVEAKFESCASGEEWENYYD
jgi:hypothetical protein